MLLVVALSGQRVMQIDINAVIRLHASTVKDNVLAWTRLMWLQPSQSCLTGPVRTTILTGYVIDNCTNSENPKVVQKSRFPEIQKSRNPEIHESTNLDIWISGCLDFWISGFLDLLSSVQLSIN